MYNPKGEGVKKYLAVLAAFVLCAAGLVVPVFAQQAETNGKLNVSRGHVAAVDLPGRVITIKSEEGGSFDVKFDPRFSTVWLGYEDVELENIKVGHLVDVEYVSIDSGKPVVNWIEIYELKEASMS